MLVGVDNFGDVVSQVAGLVSETTGFTAAASTLETRSAEVAQLVESKTIEDMPIGDRRSMNIINITGAAVFVGACQRILQRASDVAYRAGSGVDFEVTYYPITSDVAAGRSKKTRGYELRAA